MNKRRLLALAKFLETKVPEKQFDFGAVLLPKNPYLSIADISCDRLTPGCGAVGCAIGWAPSMTCFKREGWGFATRVHGNWLVKDGNSYSYIRAGAEMFDISTTEAETLFSPGRKSEGYSGLSERAKPKTVAKNIRKFVQKKEKEITE